MRCRIIKHCVILFVFSIISCKKDQKIDKINSFKLVIKNNIGKKLIIPDSLEIYHPYHYIIKYDETLMPKFKIYSHIDTSCGTCLESLNLWNKLIPELNKKGIEVILICTADDKFELLKYFFESKEIKNFSHPLFLDYNNFYLNKNKFMSIHKKFETVLTKNDNTIVLIGNPIMSTKIKDLYFKVLK